MKKGLAISSVILLTLGILVGIAIIYLAVKFLPLFESKTDADVCRNSLMLMEASKKLSIWDKLPGQSGHAKPISEPKCKMEQVVIKKSSSKNPLADIKLELADVMRRCWFKTGEGMIDPFGGSEWHVVPFFRPTAVYCILCAKISFDESVQSEYNKITELVEYLKLKRMPGRNMLYYDYFSPQNTKLLVYPPNPEQLDELDTSKTYYLIYYFRKGGAIGLKIGPFDLSFLKYSRDNLQMVLWPVDDFKNAKCDFVWG